MHTSIPPVGAQFNESFTFADQVTGRLTRRLTSHRPNNYKTNYHGLGGFAADDVHTTFLTWDESASALVRSNIETGDCEVIARTEAGEAFQFNCGHEFIPQTSWVMVQNDSEVRVFDIFTSEVVYAADFHGKGFLGGVSATCDGTALFVICNDHEYSFVAHKHTKDPMAVLGYSIIRIDLASGCQDVVFRGEGFRGGHPMCNPCDPNLLLLNQDCPPLFTHGGDHGKTSRDWLLNVDAGTLTEIQPNDPSKFTLHANWSYRGDYIYYHGASGDQALPEQYETDGSPYKDGPGRMHYIGVAATDGRIVWEHQYPYFTYGHVSTHRTKNMIIVDNLLAYEFICGIHWEDRDADDLPTIEVLAKHNSTYQMNDQTRHPHVTMSGDGKWMMYNAKFRDRSDVYAVKMK